MSQSEESCSHNCSTCQSNCADKRPPEPGLNKKSRVSHVIGIVSGKGGVGKSLVTSLMAVKMMSLGKKTAILDADITGPSIPRAFGVDDIGLAMDDTGLMIPAVTSTGISIMSANLMLDKPTDPVIWRGPVIAGAVKQFWKDTLWGDIDYMFVDMPPGTGDVPLTVFQSLPVEGIIIVTSPQDLVSMIVAKAVGMARKMNIPILGIVENMSYLTCPDCGKKISVFGESHAEEVADSFGVKLLARIPIDPAIAARVDAGAAEYIDTAFLDDAAAAVCGK